MSQFIEMFKNLPVNGVIKDLTVGNIASVKKSYSKEDIINYIDISSIDNTTKTIVETSEHLVTKAPSRAQQCVQKGDILVSTVRPINRNIAVIEKDTSHLVASTGFCILRPQEGYKEYLLSIVLSDTYTEKMYDKANGGLYPAVNNSDVLNYGIHIPDEDTAKKVSALYQQSDKSGFDGFKSQFIEMFTDKGYPLTMIKSFADVSTGGTPSKAHPEYWNGDKPWVSAEDMKSKYVYDTCEKVTEAGYATCKIIPVDTLMYVCRGSIGVMAINKIECATNQSICRATCHNNVCNVEFLYHALMYQRDNIKKKGTGTSFKSLNQTTFSELEIELPPYDEQMKFVTIAEHADKSGSVLQHMIAC